MTIPDRRLEELRELALASNVDVVTDPLELARRGIRGHLIALGQLLPAERPEVEVRLAGPGIIGHQVAVRDAAAILLSIQETVASIGQALTTDPTLHGVIQGQILAATELRMTPILSAGSVVFHLLGPDGQVIGDEATPPTSETLVEAAMDQLLLLVEQSASLGPDSTELAQDLRALGPRTAKHLSDLVKLVISDEIDVELSWLKPDARPRRAVLGRPSAQAIRRAISMNRVDTQIIDIVGHLETISTVVKAELRTESGRIHMAVGKDLAATLAQFYDKRVVASVEQVTTWSTSTGKEKKEFRLIRLRLADTEAAANGR